MIVIVDTNILFSACLTPQGRAFEVLFHARAELISSHFAIEEITRHKQKLFRLSKLPAADLEILIALVIKQVTFIDEAILEETCWKQADELTRGVDGDDIAFVALALQTGGILWTGDKKLTLHLKTMGFDRVASTVELIQLLVTE